MNIIFLFFFIYIVVIKYIFYCMRYNSVHFKYYFKYFFFIFQFFVVDSHSYLKIIKNMYY